MWRADCPECPGPQSCGGPVSLALTSSRQKAVSLHPLHLTSTGGLTVLAGAFRPVVAKVMCTARSRARGGSSYCSALALISLMKLWRRMTGSEVETSLGTTCFPYFALWK